MSAAAGDPDNGFLIEIKNGGVAIVGDIRFQFSEIEVMSEMRVLLNTLTCNFEIGPLVYSVGFAQNAVELVGWAGVLGGRPPFKDGFKKTKKGKGGTRSRFVCVF